MVEGGFIIFWIVGYLFMNHFNFLNVKTICFYFRACVFGISGLVRFLDRLDRLDHTRLTRQLSIKAMSTFPDTVAEWSKASLRPRTVARGPGSNPGARI